jgi:hypothetical protein
MNWTTLTDIGCGQSITKNGCAITVCNYQDRTNPDIPKAPNLLSNKGADKNTDFANKIKCSKPLQLSTYSQKWANQLKKDVDKNNNGNCILGPKLIRHNPGVNSKKYGENIAYDSPDKGYDQNNITDSTYSTLVLSNIVLAHNTLTTDLYR